MTIATTFSADNIKTLGFLSVKTFGATGDGITDDRVSIKAAFTAAAALGGVAVYFPPGIYVVGQDGGNSWCLTLPGSNILIRGVKGQSWLKQISGLGASSVSLLVIDQKSTITIRDIGFDGNWGNAQTTIASASNNATLPAATINVISTAGFPASGSITVVNSAGLGEIVTYTGITATSFTGCAGGAGTISTDGIVGYVDAATGINQATQVDPSNHLIMLRGAIDIVIENCLFQQSYGDMVWVGFSATDSSKISQDIRVVDCDGNMSARNGMTLAQSCQQIVCENNRFLNIFAQAFDTEIPDGYARDVLIDRCYLDTWWNPGNPSRSFNSPLSIVGEPGAYPSQTTDARKYRVTNCTIRGSIGVQGVNDVQITNNRILCDWVGFSYAPILAQMVCDDLIIADNYIYDQTTASAGNVHDASISVQAYSTGTDNAQPAGVQVRGNRIHSRNGRIGIKIEGTGGGGTYGDGTFPAVPPITGTATAVSSSTMTDGTAAWTVNQWIGYIVTLGSVQATVMSNTATVLTLYVAAFKPSGWTTPLGNIAPNPSVGTYVIAPITGVVSVDNNTIDLTNDGNGAGSDGIQLNATRAGMRVSVQYNKIHNPNTYGIRIKNYDANRPYLFLQLCDNYAWDDQPVPTALATLFFDNIPANTPFWNQMIMRGNTAGSGVPTVIAGLVPTLGLNWIVTDGPAQSLMGWGVPDGVVVANVGSTYQRLEGGVGRTFWGKELDSGFATGWNSYSKVSGPNWTVDSGSGIGCPASATEWANVLAACGLTGTVAVPDALWLCQEANGNLADSIGAFPLTALTTGAGNYQKDVLGWARLAVKMVDNVAGSWDSVDAGLPDISASPLTLFQYTIIDSNVFTTRSIGALGIGGTTNNIAYVGGAASTRATSGSNIVTAAGTEQGTVRPYGILSDHGAARARGFEDINKLSPALGGAITGKRISLGQIPALISSPTARCLYAWAWFSAPSDANIKLILQTLGWDIAWT